MQALFGFTALIDCVVLALVLLIPYARTPLRVTSPFGYISGFIGFLFLGKLFYNKALGVAFIEGANPDELTTHFRAMSMYLGIAFLLALPFCSPETPKGRHPPITAEKPSFKLTVPALLTLIALPVILVVAGFSIGLNPLENPLGFRQFIQSQGMFYLLSVYIFLLGAISIYVPHQIITKGKAPSPLVLAAYSIAAIFAIISGFASMIVSMITVPLFFWSACYRKRIEIGLIVLLPLVVAFVLLYSAYRDANLGGAGISVSDAVTTLRDNPVVVEGALNRFDYLENYAKAHRYLKDQDPDYGASLLAALTQPVPRALWPEKPENFSTSLTRELLPENLAIGVTANFNSINEFIKAFGEFGIVVGGIVFAIILVLSYAVFNAADGQPYVATYYILVIFKNVTMGFYAGFFNDLALPSFILENIFFFVFIRANTPQATNANERRNTLVASQ